jgi:hypothetical protein
MNSRGDSHLKIPRPGERIVILSHREVKDFLPGKNDIIEKTILFEDQAVDHGIQQTNTRSEIEITRYPQKATGRTINAIAKLGITLCSRRLRVRPLVLIDSQTNSSDCVTLVSFGHSGPSESKMHNCGTLE